jgi:hypothetical protein
MVYTVGSTIIYTTLDGVDRKAVVDYRCNSVMKQGPGFDGRLVNNDGDDGGIWGYDHQIKRVVEY